MKGTEKVGIKNKKNSKALVDYLQTADVVYEYLEDYNPTKKMFDDMVADMEANEKLCPIVTDLLLSGRKLNIFLVDMTYDNLILKCLKL